MCHTKVLIAITLGLTLTCAVEDAHAVCEEGGHRARLSALAPSLTMELRAERLRHGDASRRGAEVTLWASWDLARLWRARPVPCPTALPSEHIRSTP